MHKILLRNCKNISDDSICDIKIYENKISQISSKINEDCLNLDVDGRIVIPGLIDTHFQGAGGFDFLDGSVEAFETISSTLPKLGVTSFLATTVMKPSTQNRHIKNLIKFYNGSYYGARCLGIHLEGPYVNSLKKGGLSEDGIYSFTYENFKELLSITDGFLKIMTLAPEMDNSKELISSLLKLQIVPSFGHSSADYQKTIEAIKNGIYHVTHLFNAMNPVHHRNPGPVPAILMNDRIYVELIADGIHLNKDIIAFVKNIIGTDRIICITDGVQGMGLPDGIYIYNGKEYISQEGIAKYNDGTLIGTTLSLFEIMKRFKEFTGVSLSDAIKTSSLNPAKLLRMDNYLGTISPNKIADIVILDYDDTVYITMIDGKIVYSKYELI